MALKAVVETLEGLAEDVQKLYVERDGKYVLDVTPVGGWSLEDVSGLKSALGKEKENVRKVQTQLKAFENLDPEKAREALTKVEEMANWTPEQKVKEQIEAQRSKLLEVHKKELGTLNTKIETLTAQLSKALITSVATQALTEHKGSVELLLPHVERQVRMRQADDGRFLTEVIDAEGTPRYNGQGVVMTIPQLVEEMKGDNKFARAFEGTGASGSGAHGSESVHGSGGAHTISASDAKNPAKYRAAKEQATKAGQQLQIVG